MNSSRYAKRYDKEAGMVLAAILMISIFLSVIAFAIINFSSISLARARSRILLLQAQYAAESAADAALATLNNGNSAYTGTASDVQILDNAPFYRATYEVVVSPGADAKEKILTATGKVYAPATAATPKYTRQIEVIAKRSTTSVTSALVGRNIIYVESGVKNIEAIGIYVNGFIQLNKNTTNLIAESIAVADKNTSAGNCSIGGTGNLIKPATFTNPGQTTTLISTAFNNCITPPGNTSNADFTVTANTNTIGKIQSTYIPWDQYMDNTYQDAPGGCSDWTTGSFPREIPSTGNTKKTHYPDNGDGVSSSCGTAGNLNLSSGQYNINDHVHLRANLCGTAGCSITLNNPDSTLKYIFIEGTAKFNQVDTAAGSGPIVILTYGSDPTGIAGECPYGGSIYLGNSGTTEASQLYFLAQNGVCLSKTRFGSSPALGGVSGKNVYVDTSPGTPFDLKLDPTFPVDQIPVDLSWNPERYRRL